jgi:hypothetical protein
MCTIPTRTKFRPVNKALPTPTLGHSIVGNVISKTLVKYCMKKIEEGEKIHERIGRNVLL